MKATRIEEKYKEVIDKLSSKLRKEKGNTKRIDDLNKSTEYVKLFVDYLRKNPDVLYSHFNISEDDDDKIMNIWDKIEGLKILEKLDYNENKITTINIPSKVVNKSTVLKIEDVPVIIDLDQPNKQQINYQIPMRQHNSTHFPSNIGKNTTQYQPPVNYHQKPKSRHNNVRFAPSNISKKNMQFQRDQIDQLPLNYTSLNSHSPNIIPQNQIPNSFTNPPNIIPQNQIPNSFTNPPINDSKSLYDTFDAHYNNMPNISMTPNYKNSIYMTHPPMSSRPINKGKSLYNTYPSISPYPMSQNPINPLYMSHPIAPKNMSSSPINSIYDTFDAHYNNMPNLSMTPNYKNSIYMTHPPMSSPPINKGKSLYNTYPSISPYPMSQNPINPLYMSHPIAPKNMSSQPINSLYNTYPSMSSYPINQNNSLYMTYPAISPKNMTPNSMSQPLMPAPIKATPNNMPRVLNVKPYNGPHVPINKGGIVYMGGKSKINSILKESKVIFTKLLKSNKYIKYKKHLYVKYNNYLLYVPFLIAYISNKKISKQKKTVVKSKIKK